MDSTTSRPPKNQTPQKDQIKYDDDWLDPAASPAILNLSDELRNQQRLNALLGENDTIISEDPGLEPPASPNQGNFDIDFEKASISALFRSSSQPEVRHTSDRSPSGEPNFDSFSLKKNTPKSHVSANPGLGRSHTTAGPSRQHGEYYGRDLFTDHRRNLASGRRHPERRNLSPSQPAAGSKARKWEYIRHYMGRKTKFEYEYDEGGRLVAHGGYRSGEIEIYLCNHDLYEGRDNIKDCGLTLWIQQAPRTADYRGGAAGRICLYENCCVSKSRSINAGDVRVAFDESAAQTPEHDPQTNAGYVHLKCLETHMKDHRQMFANLNFKVEGRKPQPNDPLHRNPTTFGTIQEIVYVEAYFEQCRKDGGAIHDGKPSESGRLSSGIEKQTQGQSKRARDIQRKLLELNGFYSVESSLDKKYAEAGGPAEAASPTQGQPPEINPKSDTRRHETRGHAQVADPKQNDALFAGEYYQPRENQEYDVHDDMPFDPYHPQIPASMGRREPPTARILPTSIMPDPTNEPSLHPPKKKSNKAPPSKPPKSKGKVKGKIIVAPYKGKGKKKKRMQLNDLMEEIWEEFEDPWSPLESGSDHEPKKRTRVSRKEKEQAKASTADAQNVVRKKNKRQRVDMNDGEGDDIVNEAEGEDEDRREDGDEDEDEDGEEGEDEDRREVEDRSEDDVEEDHQAKKRRRRNESRG